MTKKEFIYLGIRIIGFYWLLQLAVSAVSLIWNLGYTLLLFIRNSNNPSFYQQLPNDPDNYMLMILPSNILYFLVPLFITLYFLYCGKKVYKMIDHFTLSDPEDSSLPKGYSYCEMFIRISGFWIIMTALEGVFDQILFFLEHFIGNIFDSYNYETPTEGLSLWHFSFLLTIIPAVVVNSLVAWYLLKKGKFLIDLLHRFWQKALAGEKTNG